MSSTVAREKYVSTIRESVRLIKSFQVVTSRTRSQVAKNLSAVNAYPIETGMRKDVATELNINERYRNRIQWLNEHVIPGGETLKMYQRKKKYSNVP